MSSDGTRVVAIVDSVIEADLIAGMLRANGLRCAVIGDNADGWAPQLQQSMGVRVVVAAEDGGAARRLIDDANKRA